MSNKSNPTTTTAAQATLAKCTDKSQVLALVASGAVSIDQALARINELSGPQGGRIHFKVSEKGALSVYGLQRMPVTLYVEQWERLWRQLDELQKFAQSNADKLSRKSAANVA